MSNRTPRPVVIRLLCILALAVGIVVAIQQHSAIAKMGAEHQALLKDSGETKRLMEENAQLERLRATNQEVKELRLRERELLRLRNQVGQLRAQAAEAARLREDNRRLASLPTNSAASRQPVITPPDFIPRTALVDAGLASPEAAVQTLLYALSRGDAKRVVECLGMSGQMELTPEQEKAQGKEYQDQFAGFPGFRIAEDNAISPDEVQIGVQGDSGGAIMPLHLIRNGNVWNVKM
jgi:hypothetical protein